MKRFWFLGFLLIMAGVISMGNLIGCDNGTTSDNLVTKSKPIQVYSTNDGSTVYSGSDMDLYFDGDSQKNTVAEIRSGKVTFIYAELSAALLQTVAVGQNNVSAANPVGAKISNPLEFKSDTEKNLVLQKDSSNDTVSVIYADRDTSVTFTIDSNNIILNLKKGWNFVFVNTGEVKQDPEGFVGHHWVLQ
jgi:subtilase family serine protease